MKEIYNLNQEEKERVKKALENQAFRIEFFRNRLYSFWLYYFSSFFNYPSSDKHKEVCIDLLDDKNLMLIAFREFWKSIWILVYLIHSIVYKTSNFILYFSYEQRLSASRLFDVIVQLKTNQLLIRDYWILFPDNKKDSKEEEWLQKKSVSEFITSNHIKVKSMSIWTTARWLLYSSKHWAFRPDKLFLDDVDVLDSVRNPDLINKNEEFLRNEVLGWVDSDCKIVFLWNIIWNDWLVPRFEKSAKESKHWNTQKVPVKVWDNMIWNRFVETEKEVEEFKLKWIKKISLEKKKEEQGESYNPNFMLVPNLTIWNPVFNTNLLLELKSLEYKQDTRYKELRFYKEPCKDLYIWADTAWGNANGDYSTIVWINELKQLVFTYRGKIEPYLFAEVIEYIFNLWYEWLLVVENNSIWLATIDKLKVWICWDNLYTEKSLDKITQRPNKKYWFNTNVKTKSLLIEWLKEVIHTKQMIEFDERTKEDLLNYYYDEKWAMNALKWCYDDLVIATWLAVFGTNQPKQYYFE